MEDATASSKDDAGHACRRPAAARHSPNEFMHDVDARGDYPAIYYTYPDEHFVADTLNSRGWMKGAATDIDFLRDRNAYLRVKLAIKRGMVGWLHLRMTRADADATKMATQLCRAQHRAGARWLLEVPPDLPGKGVDALGTLDGVHLHEDDGSRRRLTNLMGIGDMMKIEMTQPSEENTKRLEHAIIVDILAALQTRTVHADLFISRDHRQDTTDNMHAKRMRAAVDDAAIGGLRNPRRSVSQSEDALATGRVIRRIVEEAIGDSDAGALLSTLGREEAPEEVHRMAAAARAALGRHFNSRGARPRGLQALLLQKIAVAMGDPDLEAVTWLSTSVPLGITRPIIPAGVFPEAEQPIATSAADAYDALHAADNYASYADYQREADDNLRAEWQQGRLEWRQTRKALEKEFGQITLSRIGVIAKVKNGALKLRLIHDLKRSGVNSQVSFKERIILPRLSDIVDDILALLEYSNDGTWDQMVLDFRDAFKQLPVHPSEQRFLGGAALGGYFIYKVVLFGIKSGPLVWGRIAAYLMRLTAATIYDLPARLHCYVDDPILTVAGAPAARQRTALLVVILWLAVGGDLSWAKGQYGCRVDWIGATFRPWTTPTGRAGCMVTLAREKITKLAELTEELLAEGALVRKSLLRPYAGLASWIASILPQMNPFTRMIWAALTAQHDAHMVYARQIQVPLRWIKALANVDMGPIERRCARPASYYTILTFDASPTGGGAILQLGVEALERRHEAPIATYWCRTWTDADARLLGTTIGSASGQALWEAYAMLRAAITWFPLLSASEGKLAVCGDALGVLHDAVRFRARDPMLNLITAELALVLAPLGVTLDAIHQWSERNHICDALSRLSPASALPPQLQDVPASRDQEAQFRLLG